MWIRALRTGWLVSLVVLFGCGLDARTEADDPPPAVVGLAQGLTSANCPAGYHLVQGTNAAETLVGTAGNDCMIGLGGNDTISGGGGNDYIAGGTGDDVINGEGGDDQLFGEAGLDTINGGDGVDTISGGDGVDTIHGGLGDDTIHGDAGNDVLYGDDGNDVLDGDANADDIWGGNGDDVIYGDAANDTMHGEDGDDALIGGAGTNTSDGGPGTDACTGVNCEKLVPILTGCTQNSQCNPGQHCVAEIGVCLGCGASLDSDADGTLDCQDPTPFGCAPGAPGPGVFDGSVTVDQTNTTADLAPLAGVTCVTGFLEIRDTALTNLTALASLEEVGNLMTISSPTKPSKLTSLHGLEHLRRVGSLSLYNNLVLTDISALSALTHVHDALMLQQNTVLPNLNGLQHLTYVGNTLIVNNGYKLTDISALSGVSGVLGMLSVDGNTILTTLNGLQGITGTTGNLIVYSNNALANASALSNITSVGGNLWVRYSGQFTDLSWLSGVHSVGGDLDISNDTKLASLHGLESLSHVGGVLTLHDNPKLAACLAIQLGTQVANSCSNCTANDTTSPGSLDGDGDGTCNVLDGCPSDASKIAAGVCGCGVSDADGDGDGTPNCNDACPSDASKVAAGACGCGVSDADGDGDGTPNCNDGCPSDASKVAAGACGCGVGDADGDADGVADCHDVCPGHADQDDADNDGIPDGCDTSGECTANASGPGVHQGDVIIESQADLALLAGITCVTGSIDVEAGPIGSAPMTTLAGLESLTAIAGSLTVNKTQLESLDGLGSLTRIGGDLNVTDNTQLATLAALSNLVFVGGVENIVVNASLAGCWRWEIQRQLGRPQDINGGNRGIGSCGELPAGFVCEPGAVGPGVIDRDLTLSYDTWESPDLWMLGGVTCITGDAVLGGFTYPANIEVLAHLVAIGGHLTIANTRHTYLSPLQSLQEVGLGVTIAGNASLVGLSGLSNLTQIGTRAAPGDVVLSIHDNPCLPGSEIAALEQRTGVLCGGAGDVCQGNDDQASCLPPDCTAEYAEYDADGDMTSDRCDACPNDFGGDEDCDGICDAVDVCPDGDNTADADGDGVCDSEDLCPGADDFADADHDHVTDTCEVLTRVALLGAHVTGAAIADFDGDGSSDIVSAAPSRFINHGNFDFQATPVPASPANDVHTLDADFDGDGILDGLCHASGSTNYSLCYGNAARELVPHTVVSTASATATVVADVGSPELLINPNLGSMDGTPDLVFVTGSTLNIVTLKSRPQRGVSTVQQLSVGYSPMSIVIGDADHDSYPEIYVRSYPNVLQVYQRLFGNPGYELTAEAAALGRAFAIGDIDGDGRLDIVTTDDDVAQPASGAHGLRVYRGRFSYFEPTLSGALISNSGGSQLDGPLAFALFADPVTPVALMTARLGAADNDQVLLQSSSGLSVITYDRTRRTLQVLQTIPDALAPDGVTGLAFGDLDGDGAGDVVHGVGNGLGVLRNVAHQSAAPADGDQDGIADACDACPDDPIGDSDGDGVCDALDPCQGADADGDQLADTCDACPFDPENDSDNDGICGDVDTCYGGDDSLDADQDGVADACDSCPNDPGNDLDYDGICAAEDTCAYGPDGLDADGDGVCDAMDVCPDQDDGVDQNDDGVADCLVFGEAAALGVSGGVGLMTSADLNGDGRVDLIIGTTAGELQQWLGAADGSFTLAQSQMLGNPLGELIAADANGDGHVDLIIGPFSDDHPTARILTGDGAGQLALWRSGLAAGQKVRFGDVSGDGRPDLVYGSSSGMFALLGAADPANAYQQQITISTSLPFNHWLADFALGNLDGDPELEIVDATGYGLVYVIDHVGANFVSTQLVAGAGYIGSVLRGQQIADFDGDGANDLVLRVQTWVGNGYENGYLLYLRRPIQGVDPSLTLSAGALTFVRFDRLGVPDVTDIWNTSHFDVVGSSASELLFASESQVWIATAQEQTGGGGDWTWHVAQHIVNGSRWDAASAGDVVAGDFDGDGSADLAYISRGQVYVRRHL